MAAAKKTPAPAGETAKKTIVRRRRRVTEEMIRERAYFISIGAGGSAMDHWLTAERELVGA